MDFESHERLAQVIVDKIKAKYFSNKVLFKKDRRLGRIFKSKKGLKSVAQYPVFS
jgi:hypothetical protein